LPVKAAILRGNPLLFTSLKELTLIDSSFPNGREWLACRNWPLIEVGIDAGTMLWTRFLFFLYFFFKSLSAVIIRVLAENDEAADNGALRFLFLLEQC